MPKSAEGAQLSVILLNATSVSSPTHHDADGAVVVERAGGVGRHRVVVVQVVADQRGVRERAGVHLDAVHVLGGLDRVITFSVPRLQMPTRQPVT